MATFADVCVAERQLLPSQPTFVSMAISLFYIYIYIYKFAWALLIFCQVYE